MDTFLQEKLLPIAVKLGNNKWLIAIRDGITFAMPLLIIGSLLMVIASFPIPGWENWLKNAGVLDYFWKGVDSSFGLIGLVSSFGVAYSLAKLYKTDGVPSGIVSMSAFITVTPFVVGEAGAGMPTAYMASKGLFVAIILGLINGYVYQWFINHNIRIKMPEAVPPAVSKSFSAIIPGAVIISSWLCVYGLLNSLHLPSLHDIAQTVFGGPLGLIGNNVLGLMVIVVLNSLFWFVGLHGGNVVNAVLKPVWIANLDANRAAYQAGEKLPQIFTNVFMDNFVFIGGGGATIGLIIALAYLARQKKTSQQAKALSPITFVPGLFNINEPAMFGVPIVFNVLLLVPFILAPICNLIIAWGAMASGLVPLTYTDPIWTTPPLISGFIATGSIKASLLQLILISCDVLIYFPFVLAVEKTFKAEESQD
ncbi:PTS cellobiose transporter subunit IIC [Streptococcus iniae]|uniref:PTS sugar transporter subunit IIC n=2 Tax=Streptococcus iniae TaxID=1346 RepID=UPI000EF64786|nr:PTS sugar transporter subunit IIC [Streptococcus iniae]RLV28154.1 PTS cellobiose transporter subunit IIC [Streptococcus iniae]